MIYIDLFLSFLDKILSFEILGFTLYTYLFTITVVVIGATIIHRMIKTKG